MLVITGVVVINKGLDWLISRFKSVEKAIDGRTAEILRDGAIVMRTLRDHNIGKSELFASLREQGYTNLGQVRRAYLETSGRFSAFRSKDPAAGLRIEPAWDVAPPTLYGPATAIEADASMACCDCGFVVRCVEVTPHSCEACRGAIWTPAVFPDIDDQ